MLAWDVKNKAHSIKELSSLPLKCRDGLHFHLDPLTAPSRHGSHHLCFSAFHSTGYGECLLNEPESRTYPLPPQLPGLLYNVNKQCELIFGPGSQVCPYMVSVWGPLLPRPLILDVFNPRVPTGFSLSRKPRVAKWRMAH